MLHPWLQAAVLGFGGLAVGVLFRRWMCRILQSIEPEGNTGSCVGRFRSAAGLLAWGTAALFLIAGWRYGWSRETLVGVVLAAFLLPLALIDLKTMFLPDDLTLPLLGIVAGLRWWLGPEPWYWYVSGGVLGAGMLLLLAWLSPLLFGKEGMGMGDVKLMAGLGMATGPYGAVLTLMLASLFGIGFGLLYRRLRSQEAGQPADGAGGGAEKTSPEVPAGAFPFGPALALGGWIAFLFGEALWRAYLSLV